MPRSCGLADLAPLTGNGTEPRMTLTEAFVNPFKTDLELDEVQVKPADDRPLLIKLAGKLIPIGISKFTDDAETRFNVKPWDKQKHYWKDDFITPNQDIIEDYMVNNGATFEEAMKWAIKKDSENNKVYRWPLNFIEKAKNKSDLEKAGIKRVN